MTSFYGLPILIGFIASLVYPDLAIEYSNYALGLLLVLSAITSTKYNLSSIKIKKSYFFAILFSCIFSYVFIMQFLNTLSLILQLKNSIRISLLMVAAAPFALVAPLFSKKYQADATLSQLLVIVSSLIAPLATYFSLEVLGHQKLSHFSFVPISKILIILALIIISSLLLSSKMNFFTSSTWYKFQSKSSSLIIALLVYIFWGQTWPLFARRAVGVDEVIIVSIIMLFMDFGIFFLLKTVKKLTHGTESDAIRVTLSMRNLAIPATIIAAYSPSTLFIPAIGFICHILLFNYLAIAKKI